jgi:hypothetical protein
LLDKTRRRCSSSAVNPAGSISATWGELDTWGEFGELENGRGADPFGVTLGTVGGGRRLGGGGRTLEAGLERTGGGGGRTLADGLDADGGRTLGGGGRMLGGGGRTLGCGGRALGGAVIPPGRGGTRGTLTGRVSVFPERGPSSGRAGRPAAGSGPEGGSSPCRGSRTAVISVSDRSCFGFIPDAAAQA